MHLSISNPHTTDHGKTRKVRPEWPASPCHTTGNEAVAYRSQHEMLYPSKSFLIGYPRFPKSWIYALNGWNSIMCNLEMHSFHTAKVV